ncbi:MAG: tRNA (5-methylaminomethyl-2-thiouridine)(34)-methyltransferase MnmD, partial [Pseudomonadota bacterium]
MSDPTLSSGTPLAAPRLRWDGDQPRAADFNDIYHAADGAAETRRVFMAPADLPRRWHATDRFTVAELGFGTGLNLAVLLEAWRAQRGDMLQYISIERHPLSHAQWQRLCSARQHALPAYAQLAGIYPPTVSGWHHRRLPELGLSLHLYFGDATQAMGELEAQGFRAVDAWWLDGFAPDLNPDLWTPELLARLAPLSAPGATVTTFTAAGRVRRALSESGFEMRRVDQRPHKRETLAGVLRAHRPAPLPIGLAAARQRVESDGITIVGAGIAGASLAFVLA